MTVLVRSAPPPSFGAEVVMRVYTPGLLCTCRPASSIHPASVRSPPL